MPTLYKALTVGGSDSSSGAGIQADLKTFLACQVYGLCAITGVTAQNTLGVIQVASLEPAFVSSQIQAVLDDVEIHAAKTGLLFSAATIEAVADILGRRHVPQLVVDPVLVDKHDRPILDASAIDRMLCVLLPLCRLVTPNLKEAELLSGRPLSGPDSLRDAARALHDRCAAAVLIKGGRWAEQTGMDLFHDGRNLQFLPPRVSGVPKALGTGCTLSAAIAAHLARGATLQEAVEQGRRYVSRTLQASILLGRGQAVLWHLPRDAEP
ncbi:MAG: bifunctional hydroxymethylpyrimidine kinase/phosphomethylpyrimidine kinase [Planctomycetes bacterium]|nr:bifunctional hydroxymethylpyrimidine kinase/phosphomethylpyrimidine kinase [Planctomycetota bacterium]